MESPESQGDSSSDSPFQRDYDSVTAEVLETVTHPLASTSKGKRLTPVQKAITYLIQKRNGWASDEEILDFLVQNWDVIQGHTGHVYKQVPNMRVLHINFSIQKDGKFLFVQSPKNPCLWGLGGSGCKKPKGLFEEQLISVLKKYKKLTLKDIILMTKDQLDGCPGAFSSLSYERRVRACLVSKKVEGNVSCESDYWVYKSKDDIIETTAESVFPSCLSGIQLNTIGVDELWHILKTGGVY